MKRRQTFLIGAALIIASIMAFPLRDLVNELVINPLTYLFWVGGLYYRAIPKVVVWIILLVIVLSIFAGSYAGTWHREERSQVKKKPKMGQIEMLAGWISQPGRGNYFKWRVARLLGEAASRLLDLPEHSNRLNWGGRSEPSQDVRDYLEAALNTTFADYPLPSPFRGRKPTPFDLNLEEVITFLESQLEKPHDHRHP